ncbi:hypothetical protein EJB05_00155, partial [Eragrostis curvula]
MVGVQLVPARGALPAFSARGQPVVPVQFEEPGEHNRFAPLFDLEVVDLDDGVDAAAADDKKQPEKKTTRQRPRRSRAAPTTPRPRQCRRPRCWGSSARSASSTPPRRRCAPLSASPCHGRWPTPWPPPTVPSPSMGTTQVSLRRGHAEELGSPSSSSPAPPPRVLSTRSPASHAATSSPPDLPCSRSCSPSPSPSSELASPETQTYLRRRALLASSLVVIVFMASATSSFITSL